MLVTNRVTKKYLPGHFDELDHNDLNSRIRRRRKQQKLHPKDNNQIQDETQVNHLNVLTAAATNHQQTSKKVKVNDRIEEHEGNNKDVQYVPIPSQFPHFPILTERYELAPALSGIWAKNSTDMPNVVQQNVR